jgi:hypothetical protein
VVESPSLFAEEQNCSTPEKRALLPCGFQGRKIAKALYYRDFSARMVT